MLTGNLLSSASLLQLCIRTSKGQLPLMLLQHQCTDLSPQNPLTFQHMPQLIGRDRCQLLEDQVSRTENHFSQTIRILVTKHPIQTSNLCHRLSDRMYDSCQLFEDQPSRTGTHFSQTMRTFSSACFRRAFDSS